MSGIEAAKRLGARVDTCCGCSKEFVVGKNAYTVERPDPSGFGYACSFECAKAKVDSMPDGYVFRDNIGGEPLYAKRPVAVSDAQKAAERLGTRFAKCAHCESTYAWDPDETFSVMTNPLGDGSDYDDGTSEIVFCCSHGCASRKLAELGTGIIWRGGKCGGTLMPSLEEP